MADIEFITVSELTEMVKNGDAISATAKKVSQVEGYYLHLNINATERTLSTYLSDKPRFFRRSDALLKEAAKIGLDFVGFEL